MVDTKKEQERDELHRAIWAIADELRGAVDGWDFKNYVLGTMFYRYISENLCNYINSGEIDAGNTDFDLETYFPGQPVVNSGIAGNTTDQILASMKTRVYDYNPSKIFLLIGTNDLRDGKAQEAVVQNVEKIIEEIQTNRKQAEIFVESLYPVNGSVSSAVGVRSNEAIQNINAQLEKYCKKKNLAYIDMYSKLQDEQGNLQTQYTVDGLHLSDEGYQIVAGVLQEYMK